ncbi:MAG: outer membrane beta-barrel protein [Bergeyella sp.]
MKRILSTLFIGISALGFSQVSFAGKANLLIPTSSASWKNLKDAATTAYETKGENSTGFNAGFSFKFDTPTSFFIMPEIYYTNFKNTVVEAESKTELEAKTSRIDVPVLLGLNVAGKNLGIYAGPVASFNVNSETTFGEFQEKAGKEFTVGYQFGAQAKISKLIITARYEGAFNEDEREYIDTTVGEDNTIRYDNRPSFFILGLGYEF